MVSAESGAVTIKNATTDSITFSKLIEILLLIVITPMLDYWNEDILYNRCGE